MRDLLRRWLGLDETDEDAVEAVARLHVRCLHLEAEVRRLDALVRHLAQRSAHDMDEVTRRRRMRQWLSANDPGATS
jgi:hypothetical protein